VTLGTNTTCSTPSVGGTGNVTCTTDTSGYAGGATIFSYVVDVALSAYGSTLNNAFTFSATNPAACSSTVVASATVSCPTISLSPTSLAAPTVGVSYSQTVSASGGVSSYTFAVTGGALPAGLSLNSSTGVISGTPTSTSTATFTITATDANGCTGTRTFTVSPASCATISLTPASLDIAIAGTAYSTTFAGVGGTSPYTFTLSSGSLPSGLSLSSSGALAGTPGSAGRSTFNVTARDAIGCTGSNGFTLDTGLGLGPATVPPYAPNAPYSVQFTLQGGTPPFTCSLFSGTLPPGLTLSASCLLSGTPTIAQRLDREILQRIAPALLAAAGDYTFAVSINDSAGHTGVVSYTISLGSSVPDAPVLVIVLGFGLLLAGGYVMVRRRSIRR
jgi:hypothetical protein